MRVALVNTNRIRPPIAPIGLEYVAEAVHAAGHDVEVLDLCWHDDWPAAVKDFFAAGSFDLVGMTLRNSDDCAFSSRECFIEPTADMVRALRGHTDALVVLGGVGFSVMPERVLEQCPADAGIWGEGEFAFVELLSRIEAGHDWRTAPNLVWRGDDGCHRNPVTEWPLSQLPRMRRRWVDNPRYFAEGGQLGFETKRGCPGRCIYCADPLAKGRAVRTRPPAAVADELAGLLEQGIDHFHTCDSEFNLPPDHAADVCRELIRRSLGERMRWYAYATPAGFSADLAKLMRRAGCVGINFGVDSGDADMLARLKRGFGPDDITNAAQWCRDVGIAVMLDLLLGAPGESEASLARTVELAKRSAADVVGAAVGVRVYPGTELAGMVEQGGLAAGLTEGEPAFFIEPALGETIFSCLDKLIGGDERFFFFDPTKADRNYNYNANQVLVDAIESGARGAYWDILRRRR